MEQAIFKDEKNVKHYFDNSRILLARLNKQLDAIIGTIMVEGKILGGEGKHTELDVEKRSIHRFGCFLGIS